MEKGNCIGETLVLGTYLRMCECKDCQNCSLATLTLLLLFTFTRQCSPRFCEVGHLSTSIPQSRKPNCKFNCPWTVGSLEPTDWLHTPGWRHPHIGPRSSLNLCFLICKWAKHWGLAEKDVLRGKQDTPLRQGRCCWEAHTQHVSTLLASCVPAAGRTRSHSSWLS